MLCIGLGHFTFKYLNLVNGVKCLVHINLCTFHFSKEKRYKIAMILLCPVQGPGPLVIDMEHDRKKATLKTAVAAKNSDATNLTLHFKGGGGHHTLWGAV